MEVPMRTTIPGFILFRMNGFHLSASSALVSKNSKKKILESIGQDGRGKYVVYTSIFVS